ncbi:GNAT family N-acetyltransferase [Actinokineospora xionganensis]|uniref:GNAT family N-acetyltransferase n=1 Tax=Actinokineospora xionganensis TaxID=2684470 RepID=A0ABR7L7H7_9PSEU|nr:GNAT family N-acetyltransferase [Actinokineospora xionganensis]MBC6448640.1 GNAT family N-acetyltransferase [Actinokineospora xionganensis]
MGEFVVTPGLPDDWDIAAGDCPAVGRARWINFGQSWFPGPYQTFALRAPDGTCRVAMGGAVLPEPAAVPRRDPWHILTGRTADLGLFTADDHPWPGDLDPDAVYPCLMLMYPYYGTFPVGSEAADPAGLREFADELVAWAKSEHIASITVLYLTPPADPLVAALAEAGFATAAMGQRCDMPVTWSDFPGYLATLPKKYRDEVKRELNRMRERGLVTGTRALADDEPELLDLRCRLIAKYDGGVNRADQAAIFDMIREYVAPEDITVFTVSDGDRLVSFSLFIQDGREWTVMLTGTAYGEPNADYGYFSAMFYQPAELAPAKGVTQVSYGYGTLDAKRRRGCLLYPYQSAELRL